MTISSVLSAAKGAYDDNGLFHLIRTAVRIIPTVLWFIYYKKMQHSPSSFWCMGKEFAYFYGMFNNTWSNERCVEISITLDFIEKFKGVSILEVGNVLSNYIQIEHDVIDKYEKRPHVLNEDAASFKTSKKYDFIVSVSTLEHVGFDEIPTDETKILRVLQNLMSLLSIGGTLLVTLPRGYNRSLDLFIDTAKIQFDEQYYLRRISKDNVWKECTSDDVKGSQYGYPYEAANALVIGINRKPQPT